MIRTQLHASEKQHDDHNLDITSVNNIVHLISNKTCLSYAVMPIMKLTKTQDF